MSDKPVKAAFKPLSDGGGITLPTPGSLKADRLKKLESEVKFHLGYSALEEFIEEFGEVDEFHNINVAILAFLGVDND